jgi:hypothetical protein
VQSRLKSFISDWIIDADEAELLLTWDKFVNSFVTNPSNKENTRKKICNLFVTLVLDKAVEAKKLERASMAELVLLLSRNNHVQKTDFEEPLKLFLEFLEDLLTDVPTLYENLSEVIKRHTHTLFSYVGPCPTFISFLAKKSIPCIVMLLCSVHVSIYSLPDILYMCSCFGNLSPMVLSTWFTWKPH